MEHDYGDTDEAVQLVRDVLKTVESKVDQAAGAFMGASTGNHVMPEWLRDIVIGWVPEIGAAAFGLADDEVGKMPVVLFELQAGRRGMEVTAGDRRVRAKHVQRTCCRSTAAANRQLQLLFHVRVGLSGF